MPDININPTNARKITPQGKLPSYIDQMSSKPDKGHREFDDLEEAIRLIKGHIEKNRNA